MAEHRWSQFEQSVFKINNSFKPPFYVKTLGGYYDSEEDLCFSAGDEYIILHKLKVRSVIASTGHGSYHKVSLKIPLDYTGTFFPVPSSRTRSPDTLREIVSSNKLPLEVRLGNPQQHGRLLQEKLRGNLDCVLKLSEQVTDDYFVGKSLDGKLVFVFSTVENMTFHVKTVSNQDVKHLLINMVDLKYDIFIVNVTNPGVQFLKLEDAVENRTPPKRPPKPKSRAGKSPKSPLLSPNQRDPQTSDHKDDHGNGGTHFSYEVTDITDFNKPELKPKPPKQSPEGNQCASNKPPIPSRAHHALPKGNTTSLISPRMQRMNLKQLDDRGIGNTTPTDGKNPTTFSAPRSSSSVPPVGPQSQHLLGASNQAAPLEHASTSVASPYDPSLTKQDLDVPFSDTNTFPKRFDNRGTRRTSHKEIVTINFQRDSQSVKPEFSPPPIPPQATKKTKKVVEPPPLPTYPPPWDDEDIDTDEEYNEKVTEGTVAYPQRDFQSVKPPPIPTVVRDKTTKEVGPPPLPSHPPPRDEEDIDTDEEYNEKVTGGTVAYRQRAARPNSDYLTPNPNDSDDGSDYEEIDSEQEDYEQVDPQSTTPRSPPPLPTHPISPTTPDLSPMSKKKFPNITKQLSRLKWKNPKKKSVSGDMADDELTEDPYAEQQEMGRRSTKKRYRSPHDSLPMPMSSGPVSTLPSLGSSIHAARPLPSGNTLPTGHSHPTGLFLRPTQLHNDDDDSDSDLSDYERLDDDQPKASWNRQPILPTRPQPAKPFGQQLPPQPVSLMEQSRKRFPDPNPNTGLPSNVGIVQPSSVQRVQLPKPSTEEFPRDLCNLSVEAIADTLSKLKIPDAVVDNFRDAQIDGQIFVCLDDVMLDQLEVSSLHKLKIIKFKNGWRPNHA